jgi:23S rRNA (adenine2030-N6)-methyltransferase
MNYRHAFHAGNFADVVKHLALVAVLRHLRRKQAPFVAIDTHAGRGAYDLASDEARRTGEAAAGIARLAGMSAGPAVLSTYLDLAGSGSGYPGSPLIAARLLRPQDRLVAVEKHPDDAAALAAVLHPFRKARAEEADGYARLAALVPPPERRGVILIDPPYEAPDDFAAAARAFAGAYRRFATGIYMIWFPVKSTAEADAFCGEVLAAGTSKLIRIDVAKRGVAEGRLSAAGLLVVNPPWQFEAEMREALAAALPPMDAEGRFDRLAGDS